jgi:hypothetical protein
MPPDTLIARELTRRLVARAATPSDTPDDLLPAVHAACERTYRELTVRLGSTGADALVTRALAQAQAEHPVLKEIRISGQSNPGLDGATGAVQAHGAPAVAAGLEAALEKLLALLGRLIGDDMVARLVEATARVETQDDEDGK